MKPIKISFPHMGNYYWAVKPLAQVTGGQVICAPPITKKTIELGFKYSPEWVCVPFKYNLGNFIESLDLGANVLIGVGGGCRLGHYAEVQETILRKLGYEFRFLKLTDNYGLASLARNFKSINPAVPYHKIAAALALCFERIRCLDAIEDYVRKNIGFEKNKGEFKNTFGNFLKELNAEYRVLKISRLKRKYMEIFSKIDVDRPADCLRVAVVGEVYVVMEPFSNFFLEENLSKMGVEVHRFTDLSGVLTSFMTGEWFTKKFIMMAKPYIRYALGAHGTESVARARYAAKNGYDGVIHLKPFGCMPEVNAMPALSNISKDFGMPVMFFSFDSQTSEKGVMTRLEAFCDMLYMKRNLCRQAEPFAGEPQSSISYNL